MKGFIYIEDKNRVQRILGGEPLLYIPIRKIEEEKRLVYGIAAAEEVDRAGEIFDYVSSKPYIETWSAEQAKESGNANYGNVRAMHGDVSAGKIVRPIEFDDASKTVNVCIKVVDDSEWRKVCEGVYTGLSFGGYYVKRWEDGAATRYTLRPMELSLADRPCVPSASIVEVVKSDGSVRNMVLKGWNDMEDKVKKIDLAEFGALISDINAGLADDENVPEKLKTCVANLAEAIAECTDTAAEPEKADASASADEPEKSEGGDDPKEAPETNDVAKAVQAAVAEALKPVTASVQKMEAALAAKDKEAAALKEQVEKLAKTAAPTKVVLKTDGLKLKTDKTDAPPADDALDRIKEQHSAQRSWAY